MGYRWNDSNLGIPKYLEKTLSQCHFVHQKSHIHWPEIVPGLLLALSQPILPPLPPKYIRLSICVVHSVSSSCLVVLIHK